MIPFQRQFVPSILVLFDCCFLPFFLTHFVRIDHNWDLWKFTGNLNLDYWKNEQNVMKYMEWAASQLGIRNPEDWNSITSSKFTSLYRGSFMKKFGGLRTVLSKCYPGSNPSLFLDDSLLTSSKSEAGTI
jgi:hypothetical protein